MDSSKTAAQQEHNCSNTSTTITRAPGQATRVANRVGSTRNTMEALSKEQQYRSNRKRKRIAKEQQDRSKTVAKEQQDSRKTEGKTAGGQQQDSSTTGAKL